MPSRPLEGISVLVVEDHVETREGLLATLGAAGARVQGAPSAQAGLLMLEELLPDLLLADLELPDVDGWQLLRAVRALPPARGGRTHALALTAHNTHEDKIQSLKAGFRLHIAKPFDPVELVSIVAALIAAERRDLKSRRHK